MADRYQIGKPSRGFHTLVSEVSVLQFDRLVEEVKNRRKSGASEKEILSEIERSFAGFDELTRKKIYQLSLDLVPKDDFSSDHLLGREDLNAATCELQVANLDSRLQPGSVVYFERKRWVITKLTGESLTLKAF